jgi:hypothetical protein
MPRASPHRRRGDRIGVPLLRRMSPLMALTRGSRQHSKMSAMEITGRTADEARTAVLEPKRKKLNLQHVRSVIVR